jgi:hypothetical protein
MSLVIEHLARTHNRNDGGSPHVMTDDRTTNSLTPLLMKSYLSIDIIIVQHCTCSLKVILQQLSMSLRTNYSDN